MGTAPYRQQAELYSPDTASDNIIFNNITSVIVLLLITVTCHYKAIAEQKFSMASSANDNICCFMQIAFDIKSTITRQKLIESPTFSIPWK